MTNEPDWVALERVALAPYAVHAADAGPRLHPEPPHPYRSPFQRDRDRIIHCTAFRRLEYKTQVFVNHEGDHYRTRLTHTIEVAFVAETVCRALRLNTDLAQTIAFAHDLGHTPFGHAGEYVMRDLMARHGGFEHNLQTLRIVEKLEHRYPDFAGLNLTPNTLDGLKKHRASGDSGHVLESRIVDLSDEIAYTCHDLEDGLRSGIVTWEQLDEGGLGPVLRQIAGAAPSLTGNGLRNLVVNAIKNRLVGTVIACVRAEIAARGVSSPDAARAEPRELVRVPDPDREWYDALRKFLYRNFYESWRMMRMAHKARHILTRLFATYCVTPAILPPETQATIAAGHDTAERVICDYVAGMTDRYCGEEYQRLFEPFTRV